MRQGIELKKSIRTICQDEVNFAMIHKERKEIMCGNPKEE